MYLPVYCVLLIKFREFSIKMTFDNTFSTFHIYTHTSQKLQLDDNYIVDEGGDY